MPWDEIKQEKAWLSMPQNESPIVIPHFVELSAFDIVNSLAGEVKKSWLVNVDMFLEKCVTAPALKSSSHVREASWTRHPSWCVSGRYLDGA